MTAQKYSPAIPWVLVGPDQGFLFVRCTVCGEGHHVGDDAEVAAFAEDHRAHDAPQRYLRLGDAVAAVAKPVARAMGLDPNCTPCEARRRMLNNLGMRRLW